MWQNATGPGEHIVEFRQVGGHERVRVYTIPETPGHIARPAPVRELPGDAESREPLPDLGQPGRSLFAHTRVSPVEKATRPHRATFTTWVALPNPFTSGAACL